MCVGLKALHEPDKPSTERIFCMNKNEYRNYLQSNHWKEIKERYRNSKFKKNCYICHSPNNLDLHHKTYERLGNEFLRDLIYLCRRCHELTHDFFNESQNKKKGLFSASRKLKSSLGLRARRFRGKRYDPNRYKSFADQRIRKFQRIHARGRAEGERAKII